MHAASTSETVDIFHFNDKQEQTVRINYWSVKRISFRHLRYVRVKG